MNFLIKGNGPRTEKLAGDQKIDTIEQRTCILVAGGNSAKKTPRAVSANRAPIIPIDSSQG